MIFLFFNLYKHTHTHTHARAYIMLCLNYTWYNSLLMLHHIITLLIQYFVKPFAGLYVLHAYYAHHISC